MRSRILIGGGVLAALILSIGGLILLPPSCQLNDGFASLTSPSFLRIPTPMITPPIPLQSALERVWHSTRWPLETENEEITSPSQTRERKGSWVVSGKKGMIGREFIGYNDSRMFFVGSLPGLETSILLEIAKAAGFVVHGDNYALFPFATAGRTNSLPGGDDWDWRWWDFGLSAQRSGTQKEEKSDIPTLEASSGTAASWFALQSSFPRSRYVIVAPMSEEGAVYWWNNLVQWVEKSAWCSNGGLLLSRDIAALRAYIAPVAADPAMRSFLGLSSSHPPPPAWVSALAKWAGGAGSGMLPTSTLPVHHITSPTSNSLPTPLPPPNHLQVAVNDVFGFKGVDARLVWTLAAMWHARAAEAVFSTRRVGIQNALLLVDASYLHPKSTSRSTTEDEGSAVETICAFFASISPSPPSSLSPCPLTPSPAEIMKRVQREHEKKESASRGHRCEAAGGIHSPLSTLLPPQQRELEEEDVRSAIDPASRGSSGLKVAVTVMESHPDERIPHFLLAMAMVTSFRENVAESHIQPSFFLFHVAPLQEFSKRVMEVCGVTPIQVVVPPGFNPSWKQSYYVIRLNLLNLQGFDRILQVDSDVLFFDDVTPLLFAPPADDYVDFMDSLRPFFHETHSFDPEHFDYRYREDPGIEPCSSTTATTRTSCVLTPTIPHWVYRFGSTDGISHRPPPPFPLARALIANGGKMQGHGSARGTNGGFYVTEPNKQAFVDMVDIFKPSDGAERIDGYAVVGSPYTESLNVAGWNQYGQIPEEAISVESSRHRDTYRAFVRSYAGRDEDVLEAPFLFTFSNSEQGILFYTLFLRNNDTTRITLRGQSEHDQGAAFFLHYAGNGKPWERVARENRFPPGKEKIVRPLIEVVLQRVARRFPEFAKVLYDTAYPPLRDIWEQGKEVDAKVDKVVFDEDWDMEDSLRSKVDWVGRYNTALSEIVGHFRRAPYKRFLLGVRMAAAWSVCGDLPTNTPSDSFLRQVFRGHRRPAKHVAQEAIRLLFPSTSSRPSRLQLESAEASVMQVLRDCILERKKRTEQ